MSISNKAKQKLLRMETYAKFPYLIEITLHDGTKYRYANCDEDVTFEGFVYEAGFFKIEPPDTNESEIGNGKLVISAVDQKWIEIIRTQTHRAAIRFVGAIVYNDGTTYDTVEPIEDTEFTLTEAEWNDLTISWTMVFDEWMTINIPCDIATSRKVPGCV